MKGGVSRLFIFRDAQSAPLQLSKNKVHRAFPGKAALIFKKK